MRLDRRTLLRAAGAAGALDVVWPLSAGLSPARAREAAGDLGVHYDPAPFTLGVASGDPLPTSVLLWTRLAPEPFAVEIGEQKLPDVVEVGWVVAEDKELERVVAKGTAPASVTLGHSVHVPVGGLEPGRHYWYRFTARGRHSRVGRTKTAPRRARRIRFANANCQSFHKGYFGALRGIAREKLDFVAHLGDYIYQNGPVSYDALRKHQGPECFTLADYRRRYALYKGDPGLREAHAAHPWFLTWDDHEVANDYTSVGTGAPAQRRRAAAYQAWYEHQPHRDEGSSALPDPVLHRRRTYGGLVDLSVLDLRSYRTDPNVPGASILGGPQRTWLEEGIDKAPDAWHCWVNSSMLSQLRDKPGGERMFDDHWDGFLTERAELLKRVHATGMKDLVVVTGDWHSCFVEDIRPDFDDTSTPVIGTEFTAHAITSRAYTVQWHVKHGPQLGKGNPHLQYLDGGHNGYALYDVTPERWATHMRVIRSSADPESPVSTLTTWYVDRGKAGAYEDRATWDSPAHYRRW